MHTEATQNLDERVMRAVRRADDPTLLVGPAWLQDTARDITALGGYSVLILLVTMVAGFLQECTANGGETRGSSWGSGGFQRLSRRHGTQGLLRPPATDSRAAT